MALFRLLPARRRAASGSAKPFGLAAMLLAAALGAGCGGDEVDTGPVTGPGPTAVAGDTYVSVVSKPVPAAAPVASTASTGGAVVVAATPAVPTVDGKVDHGTPVAAPTGVGGTLAGAVPFPTDDAWNREVSGVAADPASDAAIAAIGATRSLRVVLSATEGVRWAVVDRTQPVVPVWLAGAAQPRAWPIPDALGSTAGAAGRLAVLDRDAGVLYELRAAVRRPDGGWDAAAGASWRLDVADGAPTDEAGTAADDGGLPVFPGLVRADEIDAGIVRHALRVTVPAARPGWTAPARRAAAGPHDPAAPPIGARLRLRPGTTLPEGASPAARAIVQALKTYGAIVAGTGNEFALDGASVERSDAGALAAELGVLRAADFELLSADAVAAR